MTSDYGPPRRISNQTTARLYVPTRHPASVVLLSLATPLTTPATAHDPRPDPAEHIRPPGDPATMNHLDRLSDLIAHARAAGADAADAVLVAGTSLSVARRLGKTEHVERSEGQDLGLRVFIGKQAAIVSATSIDPAGFAELAERAVAMAKVVPEDPYAGLADTAAPPDTQDLDMADPTEPSTEDLVARASAAEEAALAVPGVTN